MTVGRTAEEVYLDLTRVPDAQWPSIICTLSADTKRKLLELIRNRKQQNKNMKSDDTPSSPRKRRKCVDPPSQVSRFILPILRSEPIGRLCQLMYAAGDASTVIPLSRRTAHRYMNFWMSSILYTLTATGVGFSHCYYRDTLSNKESTTCQLIPESRMEEAKHLWSCRRPQTARLLEILDQLYPQEMARFGATSSQVEPPSTTFSVTLSNATTHLIEPYRWVERARVRQLRLQSLDAAERKSYARALDSSLKTSRPMFQDYLLTTLTSVLKFRPKAFPNSLTSPLMFLFTDRLATLVELALRLREAIAQQPSPGRNPVETLLDDPLQFRELFEQSGLRLPSLSTVKMETPILPKHYKIAAELLVAAVDAPCFSMNNPYAIVHQLKDDSTFDSSLPREKVKDEAADVLFSHIISLAKQQTTKPVVPSKLAMFGYLYCRDLFWEKRNMPPSELWDLVRHRFEEWERDNEKRGMVEERYIKVTQQVEAIHRMVALEAFFSKGG